MKLAVCHVLRYTAWVNKIKEVIDSGKIGDVVSIQHTEPVRICRLCVGFELMYYLILHYQQQDHQVRNYQFA